MVCSFTQPFQNGVLFVPFDTRQAADAIAFGQQCQRLQYFVFICAFAVENRSGGFYKVLVAGLTMVSLDTAPGLTGFDDVRLALLILKLLVIWASLVWTKISRFGKLIHRSPSASVRLSLLHLSPALKRVTTQILNPLYNALLNCTSPYIGTL